MRVFLFGVRGYMSAILPRLQQAGVEIVGLCTLPAKPPRQIMRERIGRILRRLRLRGRHDFAVQDPFASCAEPWPQAQDAGIPVFDARRVKAPEFARSIAEIAPDVILVAGFPRLIPNAVLSTATTAAINLHPSPLPFHKGGTPNRWIIRCGESETGITAHWMDADFDTGDIARQWRIPVSTTDCWGDVETKLLEHMPKAALEVLELARSGAIERQPQQAGEGSYDPPLHGKHARIDWTKPATEIERLFRAMRPKTGALSALNGLKVCLWSGEPVAATPQASDIPPGSIVASDVQGFPIIQCGEATALILKEIVLYGAPQDSRSAPELKPGSRFAGPEQF